MLPHPLTNFEIQKYYQNEPKFNDVYSRNNLEKKDEAYLIKLNKCKSTGTHWIALYRSGVEHIPKEIKKFNKYLKNTRIQFDNVWILLY